MHTPLSRLLNDKGHTIHSVSPDTTTYDCAVKMVKLGIGALLVMDNQNLVGIISERDIVRRLVGCACDPASVLVADCMTKNLVTVPPSTTVGEAMRIITERRFRHLPVVENGQLQGMISIGDLTRWVMLSQEHEISVLTGYIQGEKNY